MMRKIGFILVCAGGLLSTPTFSTTIHQFKQGATIEYELPANDPQVFFNMCFWTIKATCTIISDTSSNAIGVTMLRKTGSVNDTQLSTSDSIALVVQPGDKLHITAVSGAKVELINRGEQTIRASCTTS